MKIGIAYDLKDDYLLQGYTEEQLAEFDTEETIEGIENALEELGHYPVRIGNAFMLVDRLASGQRWDLVFNIAEGMYGYGREALVPALLDAYRIPYTFSDPLVMAVSLHKGVAKTLVRASGIPTADFVVIEDPSDIPRCTLGFPLFAKPVAEGTGKGITVASRICSQSDLVGVCTGLLAEFRQGVLVETYLPGRECTVGIVGTGAKARVVGVMEVRPKDADTTSLVYSYHTKANYTSLVDYTIPDPNTIDACAEVALGAWRALGCRDGGRVDVRMDERGIPNFIEVNPLAGLNPVHSDLPILCGLYGMSYLDLIGAIVQSACERVGMNP